MDKWTKAQALEKWRNLPDATADQNWPGRICDILAGKVSLEVVLQVLEAAEAANADGVDATHG